MAISANSVPHIDTQIRDIWKRDVSASAETLRGRFRLRSLKKEGDEVQPFEPARSGVHRSMFDSFARKFSTIRSTLMSRPSLEWTREGAHALKALQAESSDYLTKSRRHEYRLLLAVAFLFLCSGIARAQDVNNAEDSSFTILSNATNVTHWGLGAGVGAEPSPYKGDRARITPIPLFYIDNKWISVFATTLDLKIGQWNGVTLALRGRVGILEGYKASDAPILNGMQDRDKITLWYGPAIGWHTGFGTLTASYLIGGNKGQQAAVEFRKAFELGNWTIEPHADARWLNDKYVDYFYGVTPSEARIGRPAYDGTSTLNTTIGTKIGYRITKHQSVSLDLQVTHLGSGISDSPLVGKRFIPAARLGYLYQFE